jgi:hypothetical protein
MMMPLDKELEEAVRSVVTQAEQPEAVSRTLIAWLKSLSESELSQQDQVNHLESVRDALHIEGNGE